MGVYSEMDLDRNNSGMSEKTDIIAQAERRDEARQEAESAAAQQALSELSTQPKEDDKPKEKLLSEEEKRQVHEETEAKRKAEWDAKQQKKEEEELFAWENAVSVDDETLVKLSMKRVGDDAEKVTRRNMKECVTEVIQTLCMEDLNFARQVMHPRKNMIRCFKYINRKALAYVQQEMKDKDEKPINGIYGCDVPDDLCYDWAKEYFMDMEAPEDHEGEEKFTPKPYMGKTPAAKKKQEKKKPEPKKEAKKPDAKPKIKPKEEQAPGQIGFFDMEGAA